jgi:hypothetical protein
VQIREAMGQLGRHFEDILRIFRQVLTSSYFSFTGQLYEESDEVVMGFSLSPVITNILKKHFEMTIYLVTHKPLG